jgi:hypothetical protein
MPLSADTSYNVQLLAKWLDEGDYPDKRVLDVSFYTGQPDLRPFSVEAAFLCYDGDLNLVDPMAGEPGIGEPNSYPDFDDPADETRIKGAYRYAAQAAAGLVNLAHHNPLEAVAYRNIKRKYLIFNLEADGFEDTNGIADRPTRQALIAKMVELMQEVRAQWTTDGVTDVGLGIYLWPPSVYGGNPNDVEYDAIMAEANEDMLPLANLLDAFFVDVYVYTEDIDAWADGILAQRIEQCVNLSPSKPIFPFIAPNYNPDAPAEVRGYAIPEVKWRQVIDEIMAVSDGCAIWGGLDAKVGGDPNTYLAWVDAGFEPVDGVEPQVQPPLEGTGEFQGTSSVREFGFGF